MPTDYKRFIVTSGISLIEVVIGVCVGGLLLCQGITIFSLHYKIVVFEQAVIDLEQELRGAVHRISRDLRQAGSNPYGIVGLVGLELDPDGDGRCDDIRIRSDFRGTQRTSPPDGDVGDPDEVLTILFDEDTGVLRRNGQPMAMNVIGNPGGEPLFAVDSGPGAQVVVVTLSGRTARRDPRTGEPRLLTVRAEEAPRVNVRN